MNSNPGGEEVSAEVKVFEGEPHAKLPPLEPRVCAECGAVQKGSRVERGEGWIALHDWPFIMILPTDGSPIPERAMTLCPECNDKRKAGVAIVALQPYGG